MKFAAVSAYLTLQLMLLASVGHSNSRLGRVASIRGDARVVNNIEVASIAVDWRKNQK
jgi:hypothetical protein